MDQIIECIPNFSEGKNPVIIKEITDAIGNVAGIRILDVYSGRATNRTVVTFAGPPQAVVEAAFQGIKKAAVLIDMKSHSGEHPRFGATDVCPLVPVANITMEETVIYARELAERVGNELSIPVYCYEYAAFTEERRSLANCRWGGYEGLKKRMVTEKWKPDFCRDINAPEIAKTGATAIGARNFLVAYNINLNTTSSRIANSIALDVRESGRNRREGNRDTGKIVTDEQGFPLRVPGTLKKTYAIGWFIEEYGIAQISMNLTDLSVTPVHLAFDEVVEKARERGVRVTGSELVGLIPLQAMLDAGKYFLRKQKRSSGISDKEIIKIAVKSLGLEELKPFVPEKKIIEYLLEDRSTEKLIDRTVAGFVHDAASESLGPGGGSVAAAVGALGIALGGMVANLSVQKRGWENRWEEFSGWAEKGKEFHRALLYCVDEDAKAFKQLYDAFSLPHSDNQETERRKNAILEASKNAIEIPLKVMELAYNSLEVLEAMIRTGYPSLVTDAGTGVFCVRAAVESALLNVKINAVKCDNRLFVEKAMDKAERLAVSAREKEAELTEIVGDKIRTLK
jgi:glutamate formiminotransferase / formiminotetrahydrofolate cyclodeaminase